MYLPALNGYVMPVELGRQEAQATAAIAATATAALKVAEVEASTQHKAAVENELFSAMKTASLKTLGQQTAHLQKRADTAEKTATALKLKLTTANRSTRASAKQLSSAKTLLRDAEASSNVMAARLHQFDDRDQAQRTELSRIQQQFHNNLITAERHRASCDSLLASNTKCVRTLPFFPFALYAVAVAFAPFLLAFSTFSHSDCTLPSCVQGTGP
jgi:hypothetical protein